MTTDEMTTKLTGGHISDAAAATLRLEKQRGKSGSQAVSEGLELLGRKRYGRKAITQHIHHHHHTTNYVTKNGGIHGSFNDWLQLNVRAKISLGLDSLKDFLGDVTPAGMLAGIVLMSVIALYIVAMAFGLR